MQEKKMKVLVSDNLGDIGVQMFKDEKWMEVDVKTGLKPEELKSIIGEYDGIAIRSATKITEDLLEAATNLKVIGRAGIGLDNVDIPAATKRGIVVMNTPDGNVITTAEHAISMMMALTRNIPWGTMTLKNGKWEKKNLQGRELFEKKLGIIGYGKIGSIVADRARGLKMKVMIYDPFVVPEVVQKQGYEHVSLDELYANADYITVHVPKMKTTMNLLNKEAFDKMKDGVMVINCARGGIVNEADLYEAMKSGKVMGAALDVFETEPPGESPLFQFDRFICTPHLGASTKEAQTNVAVGVARQIIAYLKTGTIINAVNVPSVTGDLLERIGPYLKLAENMGRLHAQIAKGPIKEVIIEYNGDFNGMDTSPIKTAAIKGLLQPMVNEMVNFVNAPYLAKDRGIVIKETKNSESMDYTSMVTMTAVADEKTNVVCGTIFGKSDPRIVKINNFRLELIPDGNLVLIHNIDRPGAIASITTKIAEHGINIGRMQVGQDIDGDRNIIFIQTDSVISDSVMDEIRSLPLVKTVTRLEF